MRTKGRMKSSNIEDKRTPKKIKNNSDTILHWSSSMKYGGTTEKGEFKDRKDLAKMPRPKVTKYKRKNLEANSSSKKRMSKAR